MEEIEKTTNGFSILKVGITALRIGIKTPYHHLL